MPTSTGPNTEHGKAIASRNATTHGVFARDIVLPSLGEDPGGYQQVQDELVDQLRPGNLLERHYVEKIAAASWRLRRLHRWQAQLFEDDTLTEDTRLDKLDKVLRHETALQRQIDTAVKMLAKDVPQLYARRLREQALEDLQLSERECLADGELDMGVSMETRNRLYQLRKSTNQAVNELSVAPLDTPDAEPQPDALLPNLPARSTGYPEGRAVGVCAPRPAVHGATVHAAMEERLGAPDGGDLHGGDLHVGDLMAETREICQNEPMPHLPTFPISYPSRFGRGGEERAGVGSPTSPLSGEGGRKPPLASRT